MCKGDVITLEEAKTIETFLEIVEWMRFDRAYLSPYLADDPERMQVVLEDPHIVTHEKKLSRLKNLPPCSSAWRRAASRDCSLQRTSRARRWRRSDGVNKLRGALKLAVGKAPGYADRRKLKLKGPQDALQPKPEDCCV